MSNYNGPSPSLPHGGNHPDEPFRHVDLQGVGGDKLHWPVQNPLGAFAIGETIRAQERQAQGR